MLAFLPLAAVTSFAGSATWNIDPASDQWESASNWTPATIPNGPNDTATFGVSNTTNVHTTCVVDTEVNGIVFNPGASPFKITVESCASYQVTLTISGVGITNNSGTTQNFVAVGDNGGGDVGVIQFKNSATAGDLTTLTNAVGFEGTSGMIQFVDDSNGGTARVEVFGHADRQDESGLDISSHNAPGVTIGSLEGDGAVTLGASNLTIGSNNLSTTFSGVIRGAGSLTKIGTGKLTLASSNKYAGCTVVDEGVLLINNTRGSGTGTRAVQVNAGALGGKGIIGGGVTVGTGSGSGGFLSPGVDAASHRTLRVRKTLTFNSDATYRCGFNSSTAHADKVANGVEEILFATSGRVKKQIPCLFQ